MKEYFWHLEFENGVKMTLIATSIPHVIVQLGNRLDSYHKNNPASQDEPDPILITLSRGQRYYSSMEDQKQMAMEYLIQSFSRAMRIPLNKARELVMGTIKEGEKEDDGE